MLLPTIAALALVQTSFAASISRSATTCPIVFDGRIPNWASGESFDNAELPYNPTYDLGANLTWADVLLFPKPRRSLFDNSSTKAVEVTIDDRAIFTPSPDNAQTGFRRNELLPQPANANDSVTGVKTLHWSMKTDVSRPLNYSHEYQLVWLEDQDYSINQFSINVGTVFGDNTTCPEEAKSLQLRENSGESPQETIWTTPFTDDVWHNIALVLNFTSNEVQVFYSQGNRVLEPQTKVLANDLSNLGQFHFGVLKKPTGPLGIDLTKEGFQASGIKEGITYGGIFQENSVDGCVSLGLGKTGEVFL